MAGFDAQRVVITGGAGGIGMATARAFHEQGAHLLLIDIDEPALAQAREALGGVRVATHYSAIDTPRACAEALDLAGGPINALVHLAGLFERDALDPDDHGVWNRAIAANLTNAYDMAVAFRSRFDRRRTAHIVFTSSIAYRRGSPDRAPYAAAKAGIVGLTNALARAFGADNIRVNAIEPGAVMTDRQRRLWYKTPESVDAIVRHQSIKQTLLGEDIARMALFLAADDSRMVTKQSIIVDAGLR
jgi:NAD(P)-dependent dehydrogenase (short-subunit alcohol dehydrogenase family)